MLDEPLSNLDAQLRDDTRAELKQLHQQVGITTIYVTHDQVEAMTLADQIVVLNQGRIQQIGDPQAIYARPANRMVATFLGSPPMNILPVTYTGEGFELGEQSFLPCAPALRDNLQPRQGQGFDLGIRPEHIQVFEPQRRQENVETFHETSLLFEVKVVEPMDERNSDSGQFARFECAAEYSGCFGLAGASRRSPQPPTRPQPVICV